MKKITVILLFICVLTTSSCMKNMVAYAKKSTLEGYTNIKARKLIVCLISEDNNVLSRLKSDDAKKEYKKYIADYNNNIKKYMKLYWKQNKVMDFKTESEVLKLAFEPDASKKYLLMFPSRYSNYKEEKVDDLAAQMSNQEGYLNNSSRPNDHGNINSPHVNPLIKNPSQQPMYYDGDDIVYFGPWFDLDKKGERSLSKGREKLTKLESITHLEFYVLLGDGKKSIDTKIVAVETFPNKNPNEAQIVWAIKSANQNFNFLIMFGEKSEKEWDDYSHGLYTKMKGKTLLLNENQIDPKSKNDIAKSNFPFTVKIVSAKEIENAILISDPNILVAIKGSNSKMYQAFNITFCDDFSSLTVNVNNKFLLTNEGLQEFVKANGMPKHILLVPGKEYHEKK